MEQIPDAPWIREAERDGMPSGDEYDLTSAIKELKEIDKSLDSVIDSLLDAEEELEKVGFKYDLKTLISTVEDLGCDVRQAMHELMRETA